MLIKLGGTNSNPNRSSHFKQLVGTPTRQPPRLVVEKNTFDITTSSTGPCNGCQGVFTSPHDLTALLHLRIRFRVEALPLFCKVGDLFCGT